LGTWRFRAIAVGALALAAGVAQAADTGAVRGTVQLFEKKLIGGLKERGDKSGVVVYVTGFARPGPAATPDLVQKKQTFIPRVLPIVKGQSVSFPNLDDIYHNVFSVSPLATFDLGQYKGKETPRSVTFDKPGLVPVYCNIHPQMLSYVAVLENDAFVLTQKDGRFEIPNLPPGTLELNAWTPGAQRASQSITIAPGQVLDVTLRVEQTERIAPHKRKDGSDYPPDAEYVPD
jgi:plastocyanin